MKCQHCEKPATFHITELTSEEPQEFHLCQDHAQIFLQKSESSDSSAPTLANVLTQQLQVGQAAEELAALDKRTCPVCGITFYEFRQHGRLGCAHDYVCFEAELDPLIVNIHDSNRHVGKKPKRGRHDTDSQTELIRLRREMKDAVGKEDYELASRLRDTIRKVEQESADREA